MLIAMQNVQLRRQQQAILDNINWQVASGEHWAILGMNGAGKTSLLNIIMGYHYPSSGSVHVFRQPFGRSPIRHIRQKIGWVSHSFIEQLRPHFDASGLQITLSGAYASIGLHTHPNQATIQKAHRLLQELEADYLAKQAFATMSQGEKQRILIARALMQDPQLLILDEPCAGLDFLAKERLLAKIETLAGQSMTILYVTHQVDEILPIFTHTLLLKSGRIFSQGKTEQQLTTDNLSLFCEQSVHITKQQHRYQLTLNASSFSHR